MNRLVLPLALLFGLMGCGSTTSNQNPHDCLGGKCDVAQGQCAFHQELGLNCTEKCAGTIAAGQTDPTCYDNGQGGRVQFTCICVKDRLSWYRSACGSTDCQGLIQPTNGVVIADETQNIDRLYSIEEPNQGNGYTATFKNRSDWETIPLRLLRVDNGRGLKMWFVYDGNFNSKSGAGDAPYGARLFRATLGNEELLYNNLRGKLSGNWGPPWYPNQDKIQGWIGLGGAESCFPTNEHGYYPASTWRYSYEYTVDGSFSFTSRFSQPNGPVPLDVEVTYLVPKDGLYWRTIITITNPDANSKNFQYWHNYLLPAGRYDDRDTVEVLLPEVRRIEVHSTGDSQLGEEHNQIDWIKGAKVTKIHGPQGNDYKSVNVQNWLGLFNNDPEGNNTVSRYGFFNHTKNLGVGMVDAKGARTIYPKSFGGPGIGPENWTDNGSRYTEMWYSPVVRSFWDEYSLYGNGSITHETIQFPFHTEAEFLAFDPYAPKNHQPSVNGNTPDPDDPNALHETFDGPSATCGDGTYDGDWTEWFDGDRWGSGHRLVLANGEQTIGLESGSFGLRRSFGDIGGKTLTVAHNYDGNGWYEILTDKGVVQKFTSPTSGTAQFAIPAGSTEIKFKIGQSSGPYQRLVLSDLKIE